MRLWRLACQLNRWYMRHADCPVADGLDRRVVGAVPVEAFVQAVKVVPSLGQSRGRQRARRQGYPQLVALAGVAQVEVVDQLDVRVGKALVRQLGARPAVAL